LINLPVKVDVHMKPSQSAEIINPKADDAIKEEI